MSAKPYLYLRRWFRNVMWASGTFNIAWGSFLLTRDKSQGWASLALGAILIVQLAITGDEYERLRNR